jgi:molybdopterin converting factor subunit 1
MGSAGGGGKSGGGGNGGGGNGGGVSDGVPSERREGAGGAVNVMFFASAREAAGTSRVVLAIAGDTTVARLVDQLCSRYGAAFVAVLPTCAVWVNGSPAPRDTILGPGDEVALLPPVSGG